VNQLDTSPRKLFPRVYDGVVEIDELSNAEDTLFKTALENLDALWRNGFFATCDASGVEAYEEMLGITPNPNIETLEFRRNRLLNRFAVFPSYTLPWLRTQLDAMLGSGNWDAYVDYSKYELIIETLDSTAVWTHEVAVTINQIKPANLIFISSPMQLTRILANEEVAFTAVQHYYKLGSWTLGSKPFAKYLEEEVIKVAGTPSIQPELLRHVARFTVDDIAFVLINDTLSISKENFLEATATENLAKVRYEIPANTVQGTISNIKLQDASKNTLAEITVAINNASTVRMSHKIKFEEGINAETA